MGAAIAALGAHLPACQWQAFDHRRHRAEAGHWFGMKPRFWINLQSAYDLEVAEEAVGGKVARLPRRPAA
jgi:hypothetical protein